MNLAKFCVNLSASAPNILNLSHLRLRAAAYKKASGKDVPYVFGPRREGDAAECYAETTKAAQVIVLNCLFPPSFPHSVSDLDLFLSLGRVLFVGRALNLLVSSSRSLAVVLNLFFKCSPQVLGWKAELGLDDMCSDAWRWQSQNPNGYK